MLVAKKKWRRISVLKDPQFHLLLFLTSVIIRLPFANNLGLVTYDGTFYINQAKTLFSTNPPAGAFPIGYPFFVACLLPLIDDAVIAARNVSFLSGIGSVAILYVLARMYLSKEVSFACALVLSATPLFIRLSLMTFSESLYIFWLLVGLLLYAKQKHLASGLSLGVAAITRPEALGVVGMLGLFQLRKPRRLFVLLSGCLVIYLLNVAAFYVWWDRLELLPKREFLGASTVEVEPSAEKPRVEEMQELLGSGGAVGTIAKGYLKRLPSETLLLAKHLAFVPMFFAILGIVAKRNFLLVSFLPFLFYPLFTVRSDDRYILPYIPIAILYAFIGATSVRKLKLRRVSYTILLLAAVVGAIVNWRETVTPVEEGWYEFRLGGRALGKMIRKGAKIADRKPYLAFYAEGQYVQIPVAAYEETMQSLVDGGVEYLSLHAWVIRRFRPSLWPLASDPALILGETRFKQFLPFGQARIIVYKRDRSTTPVSSRRLTHPVLGSDSHPAWSPDGREIVFASTRRGNSDIYVIPTDGGVAKLLVDWPSAENDPAWSPDGGRIAFSSTRQGASDIYTIEVDTGKIQQITSHQGFNAAPSWSTDGREVIFYSDRTGTPEIWSTNISSGAFKKISDGGVCLYPNISPDGTRIACVRGTANMIIYNRETGETIVPTEPAAVNYSPAWSPDGKYIAVTAKDWGSVDVYMLKSDGSRALVVTKHSSFDGHPSWSPDGDKLAIVSDREQTRSIWILSGMESFKKRLSYPVKTRTLPDPLAK